MAAGKELEAVWTYDFKFDNKCTEIYFAFCFPYTLTDYDKDLQSFSKEALKFPQIYYKREHLTSSYEGRRVDLITISSNEKIEITKLEPVIHESLFPLAKLEKRCNCFENGKLIVFLSARVHPGETPASYGIRGVIKK
jgi:hypothetical protein